MWVLSPINTYWKEISFHNILFTEAFIEQTAAIKLRRNNETFISK